MRSYTYLNRSNSFGYDTSGWSVPAAPTQIKTKYFRIALLFNIVYDMLKSRRLIAGQESIIQIVLLGRSRWRVPFKKINTTRTA